MFDLNRSSSHNISSISSILENRIDMTEESEVGEATPLVRPASSGFSSSDEENGPEMGGLPDTAAHVSTIDGNGPIAPAPDGKSKKKRMKGIKMTKTGALMVERQVQMNLIKHNLAAKYFGCRQFWFFTVPQAILTMISSILAFVATTELIDETPKIILNTFVGSTSGIVVFLQTMSGICNYGIRGAMHEGVAIDLRDLRDDLVLIGFKLGFTEDQQGSKNPSATPTGEEEEDSDELNTSFESIQSRFQQILSGCKSNVPMELMESFHGIKSNLMVGGSKATHEYFADIYGDPNTIDQKLEFKVYDILASEILEDRFFPLYLPDSKRIVEETMSRLRIEVMTYNSFWADGITDVEDRCSKLPCLG
jgi:hypothetical protein